MVDFNNDVTIGTPAIDVMRILILEARHNLFESIEKYKRDRANGIGASTATMKSRLWRLFTEIAPTIKRFKPDEYEALSAFCLDSNKSEFNDILSATQILIDVLDGIELTRIDNKVKLGGNIKDRNKAQGWKG